MSKSRLHEVKADNTHAERRQKLLETLDAKSIVILSSNPIAHRNGDIEYAYRQDSNFFYLTGFNEPESIAVFSPGRKEGEFILFNRPRDPEKETWTGKRAGQEGACELIGADESHPIEDFKKILPQLLKDRTEVFFPINDAHKNKDVIDTIKSAIKNSKSKKAIKLSDIEPALSEMRQIKDASEIAHIKKAIEISEKAHLKAMQRCKPGLYEYQLEAELMHEFLDNGAQALAYPNIVASGENSCTLHYEENNRQIKNGDLVLIDAGAEYKNYSADITRTFPANGKFTKEQRAIYELVLEAQEAGIKAVAPGSDWTQPEAAVDIVLTKGLLDLGILEGDLEELLEQNASKKYYMHGAGHWMGLDVHDSGPYTEDENAPVTFKPGMTLTMEPGIYIKPSPDIDKRWHNIGIRIEDDVLVTQDGCEVLSRHLPKKPDEIEAIMAGSKNERVVINYDATVKKASEKAPEKEHKKASNVRFFAKPTSTPEPTVEAEPILRRLRPRKS